MLDIYLYALTLDDCIRCMKWRNEVREALRTPGMTTSRSQEDFYRNVVCNPTSPHRYWAVRGPIGPESVPRSTEGRDRYWAVRGPIERPPIVPGLTSDIYGMAGLTYIQPENGMAEISLLLDPGSRGRGVGEAVVDLLLIEGFDRMRLETIIFECYECNAKGVMFWNRIAEKYGAYITKLPRRKFWAGKMWDSYYYSIRAEDWRKDEDGDS